MAELLEGAELPDGNHVPEVEVRARGVEALLDDQRDAGGDGPLELPDHGVLGDDLHRAAADRIHLLVEGREGAHALS